MSLKSKLRQLLLRFGPRKSAPPSPIQAWLQGEDWHPAGSSGALASPYQQSVWVYTAVSALAQTVSAMPFRISRGDRSGENVMSSGPAVALFNQPHPYLNRFRFWEFIVTWYCLRGEAFIIALDRRGSVIRTRSHSSPPDRLLVLNPDHFRHVVEGYDLIGWRYMPPETAGPTHP